MFEFIKKRIESSDISNLQGVVGLMLQAEEDGLITGLEAMDLDKLVGDKLLSYVED